MINLTKYRTVIIIKRLVVICFFLLFNVSKATETVDVIFDGTVLTVPYVKVGDTAYEIKLAPSNSPSLSPTDCPILCLEIVFASESTLITPRNPPTFDGTYLYTPRVISNENIFTGKFRYLDKYTQSYFFSVSDAAIAPIFSPSDRQTWTSDELEARFSFCANSSSRMIAPAPFADMNADGYQDILFPFNCYQDELPGFENGVNNVKIKSGMLLFCSDENAEYSDCSFEIFGEEFIDTSKFGGPGGSYYIHNAEEPKDLNNDGYPDYPLNLQRDDGIGRKIYDVISEYDLLVEECFDGDESIAEKYYIHEVGLCAYFSDQYAFLSNGDGTYSNVRLPWLANWTHGMRTIPNEVGGHDLISLGYGETKVARIEGIKVTDVTAEYQAYDNFEFATRSTPYGAYYFEFEGIGYWINSGIKSEFIENIAEYSQFKLEYGENDIYGLSLWKWNPGKGFEFSDYYIPEVDEFFNFINERDEIETGVYKRGIPQLNAIGPSYNFMKQAVLDPAEGMILVTQGETSGFLRNTNRIIQHDFKPNYDQSKKGEFEDTLFPVVVIEGFIVKNGKISRREKSIIEGEVLFNSPGFYFRDINNDGYDDMLTITGMRQSGSAYLNDGNGKLEKINTNVSAPSLPLAYSGKAETMVWPLRNNGTIDFISVEGGMEWRPSFWNIESDGIFRAGNISIVRSNYPIESLPKIKIKTLLDSFYDCAMEATGWIWTCPY